LAGIFASTVAGKVLCGGLQSDFRGFISLGRATEHEKLAMDPWRIPEKVLTGHPCDQSLDLTETLGRPPRQRPRDRFSKSLTSRYDASARRFAA